MKESTFISVCIILDDDISYISKLENISFFLSENYNYYEIVIIFSDPEKKHLFNQEGFKKIKNIRLLELPYSYDKFTLQYILLDNSIGDYMFFLNLNLNFQEQFENILSSKSYKNYDVLLSKREKSYLYTLKNFGLYLLYKLIYLFTKFKISIYYLDFIVLDRKTVNIFLEYNRDKTPIFLFLSNISFNKKYFYLPESKNENKNKFFDYFNSAIDFIISYSHNLIRLGTIISLLTCCFNFIYIFYALIIFYFKSDVQQGWTSSSIYSSITNCVLFFILSIISEYLRFIIREKKGFNYDIINEKNNIELNIIKNIDNE